MLVFAVGVLFLRTAPRGARAYFLRLLAGAALCHGAMAASPSYPMRAMLGCEVYLITALLYAAGQLACLRGQSVRVLCAALAVSFLLTLPGAAADVWALRRVTDSRAASILAARAAGETEVTVPIARASTRFSPLWGDGLSDLMQDPANERNTALAFYYAIPVIRGDPGTG